MEFTGERFIPGQGGAIELEHLNRYYFVVHQIDLKGKTVLDIASGEGYGSNIIAKHASKVIGVDINFEAIEHAKNKYKANNIEFIQGSVVKIPMGDSSVDVVVSFETLEHHDKHDEMMLEIKRILRKNGILMISSPNKQHFSNFEKNSFHVKELFYEEFKDLMNQYFSKTIFYVQRSFVGSMIALDGFNNEYKKPLLVDKNGTVSELRPVYILAIGTDNESFKEKNNIVLYKEIDGIITLSDIENAVQNIKETKAYRLGKLFIQPFSIIRKIMKSF